MKALDLARFLEHGQLRHVKTLGYRLPLKRAGTWKCRRIGGQRLSQLVRTGRRKQRHHARQQHCSRPPRPTGRFQSHPHCCRSRVHFPPQLITSASIRASSRSFKATSRRRPLLHCPGRDGMISNHANSRLWQGGFCVMLNNARFRILPRHYHHPVAVLAHWLMAGRRASPPAWRGTAMPDACLSARTPSPLRRALMGTQLLRPALFGGLGERGQILRLARLEFLQLAGNVIAADRAGIAEA